MDDGRFADFLCAFQNGLDEKEINVPFATEEDIEQYAEVLSALLENPIVTQNSWKLGTGFRLWGLWRIRLKILGKKNMADRILVDANVLLDYLLTREPFYENAEKIIRACVEGKVKGCIAAHSVSNMFFIPRKDYNAEEKRELLIGLCTIFDIHAAIYL